MCSQVSNGLFRTTDKYSLYLNDLLNRMLVVDPAKRLTVGQILNHPWVLGDDKEIAYITKIPRGIKIFSEAEKSYIQREFILSDVQDGAVLDARAAMQDDRLDSNDFMHNSLRSTIDPEKANVSTLSSILGPYNSSDNDSIDLMQEIDEDPNAEFFANVDDVLRFDNKVLVNNREYEAVNNAEIDHGVEVVNKQDREEMEANLYKQR